MLCAVCFLTFMALGTPYSYIPSSTAFYARHQKKSSSSILMSALKNDDSFDIRLYADMEPPLEKLHFETSHSQSKDEHSVSGLFSDRRSVLATLLAPSMFQLVPTARAAEKSPTEPNLDCLLDLPPIPNDCVRVYLCRHGQTENNRLRLVQGARVDPPINENGEAMAHRLGIAFAKLDRQCPQTIMHSTLLRAKQTALTAAKEMGEETIRLEALPSLGEVDFGPMTEGKQVSAAKPKMIETYGLWSAGLIDTRPEGGGDSARDVSQAIRNKISVYDVKSQNLPLSSFLLLLDTREGIGCSANSS